MLPRTIDPLERLLVEQNTEPMSPRHLAHEGHDKHVVIHCKVTFLIDRGEFELVRGDLVVPCLDRNTQLQSLNLQVLHKASDPCRDCTEVMVLELLVLRSLVSHQCTPRKQEVGPGGVESFID